MLKGNLQNSDPLLKLIFFIGIVLVSLGLISILTIPIVSLVFGKSYTEVAAGMSNWSADNINELKLVQVFSQLGMMIIPAFISARLFSNNSRNFLQFRKLPLQSILLITILTISLSPLINLFLDWNSRLQLPETLQTLENSIKNMEAEAEKLTEAFLIMHHTKDLFLNLLMIALLPAIGEELLFRGILQKLLTEATGKIHLSIIITGIIFSAIHMQFFGFLPRMMLGIFLGYLLLWTRTIWAPILAHFINNASAVLMSWYEQQNHLTLDEDKIGIREGELWLLFASLIITLSGCYLLYRNSTRLKTAD